LSLDLFTALTLLRRTVSRVAPTLRPPTSGLRQRSRTFHTCTAESSAALFFPARSTQTATWPYSVPSPFLFGCSPLRRPLPDAIDELFELCYMNFFWSFLYGECRCLGCISYPTPVFCILFPSACTTSVSLKTHPVPLIGGGADVTLRITPPPIPLVKSSFGQARAYRHSPYRPPSVPFGFLRPRSCHAAAQNKYINHKFFVERDGSGFPACSSVFSMADGDQTIALLDDLVRDGEGISDDGSLVFLGKSLASFWVVFGIEYPVIRLSSSVSLFWVSV